MGYASTLAGNIQKVGKSLGITRTEAKKLQLIVAVDIKEKGMVAVTEQYLSGILPKVRGFSEENPTDALDHFIVIAQMRGTFGFAWGKAKTIEDAKAICKKEGGDMRRKIFIHKCDEQTVVNEWGQICWKNPEHEPVRIK